MTQVFSKLNYKAQTPILIWNAPQSFDRELSGMTGVDVHLAPKAGVSYSFILAFTAMKADLLKAAKLLGAALEEGAVLWFAYPKLTSKSFTSDLNRDICWEALAPFGFRPVRQIAIDDDWSALRFKKE